MSDEAFMREALALARQAQARPVRCPWVRS